MTPEAADRSGQTERQMARLAVPTPARATLVDRQAFALGEGGA